MSEDYVNLPTLEGKTYEQQLNDFLDHLLEQVIEQQRLTDLFRTKNLGWYAAFHSKLRERTMESIHFLFQGQLDQVVEWKSLAEHLQRKVKTGGMNE